jgi:multidrug efflux pump subunit AcrB
VWIVRLALRRPYTFVVLALLLFKIGPLAILRTPTDFFPNINIPVVSIVWSYNGFSAEDMANRITSNYERALTSDVENIEHIESQSLNGVSIIKIFFHPGADMNRGVAEATSDSASILRILPPGTLPPNIINYNASTVPILQLGLSSNTLPEQALYDLGNSPVRTQLATVQGAAVPAPYGGKIRRIMVDIDPRKLQAKELSPSDVVNAVNVQNLILPGGTAKIGTREYNVQMNGGTNSVAALNDLPILTTKGGVVYLQDIAQVRAGYAPQTNIVRSDGKRAALLTVEQTGSTSTLTIIQQIKSALPGISAGLPKALTIAPLADQSVFVKSSILGVVREPLIAASLTVMMILLFLGSWRATVIIAVTTARTARARDRDARGPIRLHLHDRDASTTMDVARCAERVAVAVARGPPRHRDGRTPCIRGQCASRRGKGSLFSEPYLGRQRWLGEHVFRALAYCAEPFLVARSATRGGRSSIADGIMRCSPARVCNTMPPWRTIGRRSHVVSASRGQADVARRASDEA